MKKKILGVFVCMLLIATALPAVGTIIDVINTENNTFTMINGKEIAIAQNGIILDQDLDVNGQGYTVMHIWGSHYEMGYAHAELLDQYIVCGINEMKSYLGEDYNLTRDIIADTVWMPPEIEDEIDGMVDSLAVTYPSENIDELDLKVINTFGDWNYAACRSHTCWGRYVAEPIKTLSTRRLDYPEFPFTQDSHHVLCAREPDDGSVQWVNLGPPGYITSPTGVNEFGTLVSSHDYQSYNSDTSPGRMPRMVAFRHAMTYATDPDVSTHINTTFNELQNYEIMTGTFLNYYAPEGNGGVMTANPYASGPDFWHLRRPNESWHHGEAMITTNAWTDGSYTPPDENFGADAYYDNETPKTQESHWDLLRAYSPSMNMHMLSVSYRDRGSMTIWADGRLPGGGHTSRMEYEWSDLFDAESPSAPDIDGPNSGKAGQEYDYDFTATDPNGDDVKYYIDWGDDSTEWTGFSTSGTPVTVSHTWAKKGTYIITAYAQDEYGLEGPEGTLEVSMPRSKSFNFNFPMLNWLLERFPNVFPLLRQILGL
ncbi:MAG: PKD domain-containing protein [Thermoplasmatales archaeon]|nr:MAG: PKD domain-containing protein [Thermoplasmatales archaeon]